MKKFWVITDTHFNHAKLIEWGRPADFEAKIEKSLQRLTADDVLIHLGDICIGKDEEMHQKYFVPLKCKKWLVRGNHDGKSYSWYLEHGWDFISESIMFVFHGKKILFTHKPAMPGNYDLNIHGHLHDNTHHPEYDSLKHDKQVLISLEKMGYQAFSLDSLVK